MGTFTALFNAVIEGETEAVVAGVQSALAAGQPAETILKEGLIAPMTEVGELFAEGEFFIPDMLKAARAMQAGLARLKPHLAGDKSITVGKVVTGTVKGDMHDIGKNLVGMMLEGAGFEVIDLGTDVPPEKFAAAVREQQPILVALSALLTTTMPRMADTIEAIEDLGLRQSVKIIVGGAPVTGAFAEKIGADGYAADAGTATRLAKSLIGIS